MKIAFGIYASWLLTASFAIAAQARIGLSNMPSLPDVEPPPLGQAQWVAEHMRMNGLPVSVKSFSTRMDVDAVFNHYESWARTGHADEVKRLLRGEWQVLVLRSAHHFISIQARTTISGAEGTITVSPLPGRAQTKVQTQFPHPESARIVNLQQYQDAGVESEHIGLVSARSVLIEALAFSQLLSNQGWRVISDGPAATLLRGHVIEAQRGAEHARLTLQPDQSRSGGTAIIVVWKKS